MNYAHLHLMVNHVPVIGMLFALALWIASWSAGSRHLRNAALVGFVFCALAAGAANLTGEEAEEAIERLQGVSKNLIEGHEEAAEPAWIATVILGVFSLAGVALYLRKEALPRWLAGPITLGAVVACILMLRAANQGGLIRHPEIQGGLTSAMQGGESAGGAGAPEAGGETEAEEDGED
ncbi:MAG: hypothetical protein HYY13_07585 [Nitrospirae bacterium]|nr:hypothetical protein [Nitrospirota bacterium]